MTTPDQVVGDGARFAAGWGTLSLINAGLAQSKDRRGLLWWVFSLVLGPIATFLIVVLPRVEQKPKLPTGTQGT